MRISTLALSALLLGIPAASFATVLTFDGANCAAATTGIGATIGCVSGGYLNQTYGDTANLNITYSAGGLSTSLQRYRDVDNSAQFQYSNLTDVIFGLFGTTTSEITFAPIAGQQVTLNSLNLGTFPNTVAREATVSVIDTLTNAVLFTTSFTNAGLNPIGLTAVLVSPNVTSVNGLRLVITTGDPSVIGIDNLNFDVTAIPTAGPVPEPATLGLVAFALAAVVGRKRLRL